MIRNVIKCAEVCKNTVCTNVVVFMKENEYFLMLSSPPPIQLEELLLEELFAPFVLADRFSSVLERRAWRTSSLSVFSSCFSSMFELGAKSSVEVASFWD